MKSNKLALATALVVVCGLALPAQTSSTSSQKSSSSTSGGDLFEINLFGGGNFVKRQNNQPNQDLSNGGIAGFRIVENIWNYVSLEQTGMVHGIANVQYRIPGTNENYGFGARLRQFHFNPVLHFKPREARIRPFLTMGVGFDYFGVTDDARRAVGTGQFTPFKQVVTLESQFKPAFNYGGGIKAKVTDRVGLRFDIRGFATASPDYGIPVFGPAGAITYSRNTPLNSLQTTGGISIYLGAINNGPVCVFTVGQIDPSTKTVWRGESASYNLPITNDCLGVTPKYRWTVDGNAVAGDSMIAVKDLPVGEHQLKAVVEADTTKVTDRRTRNFLKKVPVPASERNASLIVKAPKLELVSLTLDPTTLNPGGTSRITSVLSYEGPEAGEEVTLTYTASAGTLSSDHGTASSDGKSLTHKFTVKPGNTTDHALLSVAGLNLTPGGPSATVDVTATVGNSSKRATATVMAPPAPAPIAAPAPPKAMPMQLDDIVFGKNGARVNNCGKRILDQAFEKAASMGDYDVLLVGHFDAVEKNIKVRDVKAKKSRKLDEERVLQVAAVLSAGVEPCKRLERTRIKVATVGAEQLSPFKTSLCEATVKELASGKINAKDGNAKNRRVEIWLVPKNGPMPNGIAGIADGPVAEIQSKGCPK